MKRRNFLSALLLALVCVVGAAAQSVVITTRKVTYTRPDPIADHKKIFVINYPKVKAATAALSRQIEAVISYEKAFGFTVAEELRSIQWLENADYEVLYNKNGLLCVALSIEGSGAYPDGSTKRIVVDTKSGRRVLPGEVFVYLGGLVDMITKEQKKEIATAIAEIKADKNADELEPEKLFQTAGFRMDNLKGFSIDGKGVTFYYDYGFPHVIQALEPDGSYSFTWAQMKPYIRVNSALGRMTR